MAVVLVVPAGSGAWLAGGRWGFGRGKKGFPVGATFSMPASLVV